jgi:hypothetical protein
VKSVFNYIVAPKHGRSTSAKEIDGKELILNTELQNHHYTSRLGVVSATPLAIDTDIQPGDEVIVHHNIFRRFRDIRGKEKNGKAYYDENTFFVQPDQIYAYKHNGEWKALDGYCFIKPLKSTNMFSVNPEREGVGVIKYASEEFNVGELVGFKPGMEYEFNIEGERLYRVPANQITIKYEYQGNEEEYNPLGVQGS